MDELMTLGVASTFIGGQIQVHHLAKLAIKGSIPFMRIGRLRIIKAVDIPAIREACKAAGYFVVQPEMSHAKA